MSAAAAAAGGSRARVLAGFRRLNRARIQLFKGDDHAMQVTRQQMRAEFERNKSVPTSGPHFEALVAGIDEAADMLLHEIIRGDLNEDTGRYRKSSFAYSNFPTKNFVRLSIHRLTLYHILITVIFHLFSSVNSFSSKHIF